METLKTSDIHFSQLPGAVQDIINLRRSDWSDPGTHIWYDRAMRVALATTLSGPYHKYHFGPKDAHERVVGLPWEREVSGDEAAAIGYPLSLLSYIDEFNQELNAVACDTKQERLELLNEVWRYPLKQRGKLQTVSRLAVALDLYRRNQRAAQRRAVDLRAARESSPALELLVEGFTKLTSQSHYSQVSVGALLEAVPTLKGVKVIFKNGSDAELKPDTILSFTGGRHD